MAERWTVGCYLVEMLAANGIDTVFGIPGVHTLELYRGLAATGMRHILVRHEQGAGFAADGYARVSGRPAAAFVISGPGLTNILTPLAQAYSDSVPLLVIASTPARATLGKGWGVLHELRDQRALAAGAAGSAYSARSAEDVSDHLRAIFGSFRSGRPRPAYLEIPLDLLAEPTTRRGERFPEAPSAPQPDARAIAEAARWLSGASRPLIIAGGGASTAGAHIRELAERLDAFVITTTAAKGVLPETHEACLGASLPFPPVRELASSCDVVLAIGTEISETDLYFIQHLPLTGRLIRVDIDPVKLEDHYGAQLAIWGDAGPAVEAIARLIEPRKGWRSKLGGASALRARARFDGALDGMVRACARALQAIRAAVPMDGVVFGDMTQITYIGGFAFPVDRPGSWFAPSGYGTLGFAFPAALGAKVAQPHRAVVALAGDFGLQYTSHELATAVELELGLPIVLWNNRALAQIRDDMQTADIPPIGVVGRNPDFLALARAYGAEAQHASGPEALTTALKAALARSRPTLIEVFDTEFQAV
jgi:5-guanidino-2-oxopentanoate decarboxylase